jgi:hypothetical protein
VTAEPTLLEQLEASVAATLEADTEVDDETVDLEVSSRPGWAFRYKTYLSWADESQILARAAAPETPAGQDPVEKGIAYATACCVGLLLNGEEVKGSNGAPLTFSHPELMRLVGAENETDCVRKVFIRRVKRGGRVVTSPDEPAVARLGVALGLLTGWEAPQRNPTKK